jgi:hypothetical protein
MKVVRDTPQDNGIPEILWAAKNVVEVKQKDTRGVYFLFLNEQIVYVGQSGNVYSRIKTHIEEGVKIFNRSFVQIIPPEINLLAVEKFYILKFRPKYNYETNAKSCDTPLSSEYVVKELANVWKGKIDQIDLKEEAKRISSLL